MCPIVGCNKSGLNCMTPRGEWIMECKAFKVTALIQSTYYGQPLCEGTKTLSAQVWRLKKVRGHKLLIMYYVNLVYPRVKFVCLYHKKKTNELHVLLTKNAVDCPFLNALPKRGQENPQIYVDWFTYTRLF